MSKYYSNRDINEIINTTDIGIKVNGKLGPSDKKEIKKIVKKCLQTLHQAISDKLLPEWPKCIYCKSTEIIVFDSNNDICNGCGKYMPAVIQEEKLNSSTIKQRLNQIKINFKLK